MKYFTGLDVSLATTFVSIVDDKNNIIKEGVVKTDAEEIFEFLEIKKFPKQKIGIESGQLSISLCKSLSAKGLDVICVDARHMAAALSARINKNDKNDARGIANMIRVDCYKEVAIKSDFSCQMKMLLGSRRQIVNNKTQICGTIRGLLKIYGIRITARSSTKGFEDQVVEKIARIATTSRNSINALLSLLSAIKKSLSELDAMLIQLGKNDQDCQLLTTVPGVGVITAMTYKATIDEENRFKKSSSVGAYIGLTPRQYASGEVNRQGHISKMGAKHTRTILYEAAQSLLITCKKQSKLKSWGLKIAKKKGRKKAIVALARKMAVIMHRMLIDKTEFCYS